MEYSLGLVETEKKREKNTNTGMLPHVAVGKKKPQIPKILVNGKEIKLIDMKKFRYYTVIEKIKQRKRRRNGRTVHNIDSRTTLTRCRIPEPTLMKPPVSTVKKKPPPDVTSPERPKPAMSGSVGGVKSKFASQNDIRQFMVNTASRGNNTIRANPGKNVKRDNNNTKGETVLSSKSGQGKNGGKSKAYKDYISKYPNISTFTNSSTKDHSTRPGNPDPDKKSLLLNFLKWKDPEPNLQVKLKPEEASDSAI